MAPLKEKKIVSTPTHELINLIHNRCPKFYLSFFRNSSVVTKARTLWHYALGFV
jgi:hypothetical protein